MHLKVAVVETQGSVICSHFEAAPVNTCLKPLSDEFPSHLKAEICQGFADGYNVDIKRLVLFKPGFIQTLRNPVKNGSQRIWHKKAFCERGS